MTRPVPEQLDPLCLRTAKRARAVRTLAVPLALACLKFNRMHDIWR